MTMGHLFVHDIVIERATEGARDEYGVEAQTFATLATVRGLITPKTARELAQLTQGGPVSSTHTVYLFPSTVTAADRVRDSDANLTYQIDGVRQYRFGTAPHDELDAHLVTDG